MKKIFIIFLLEISLKSQCFINIEFVTSNIFEKNFYYFAGVKLDQNFEKNASLGVYYKVSYTDNFLIASKIQFFFIEKFLLWNLQLEYKKILIQVGVSHKKKVFIYLGFKYGENINIFGGKKFLNEKIISEKPKKILEDVDEEKDLPGYMLIDGRLSTGSRMSSKIHFENKNGFCNKKNEITTVSKKKINQASGPKINSKFYVNSILEEKSSQDQTKTMDLIMLSDIAEIGCENQNFNVLNEEISQRYIEINRKITKAYKDESENLQAHQAYYRHSNFNVDELYFSNGLYYTSYYYKFPYGDNIITSFCNKKTIDQKIKNIINENQKILSLLPSIEQLIDLGYRSKFTGKNWSVFKILKQAKETVTINGKLLKDVLKEKQKSFIQNKNMVLLKKEDKINFNNFLQNKMQQIKNEIENPKEKANITEEKPNIARLLEDLKIFEQWLKLFNDGLYNAKNSKEEYARNFLLKLMKEAADLVCSESEIIDHFRTEHENEKILLFLSMVDKFQYNGYKYYESQKQFEVNLYAFKIFELAKETVKINGRKLEDILKQEKNDITISFKNVSVEEFKGRLRSEANNNKLAKQWSNEFEHGLINAKEDYFKNFLARVMKKMSDLLILDELYDAQNKIINENEEENPIKEFNGAKKNIYNLTNFDNNLFEKYYKKKDKEIEKRLKTLRLYSSVHKLLNQKYKKRNNHVIKIKKNDFIRKNIEKGIEDEDIEDIEDLFDQKNFETSKKNIKLRKIEREEESAVAEIFENDIRSKSGKISENFNRNLSVNKYNETILCREGVPHRILKHDLKRVYLYENFEIEDFFFNLRRDENFFNISRVNRRVGVDVKHSKYCFQDIYLQGIIEIEKIRQEMASLLKNRKESIVKICFAKNNHKNEKNEKREAILSKTKAITKKIDGTINKLKRELANKLVLYNNNEIRGYGLEHVKNLNFIKERIGLIEYLIKTEDNHSKNSINISATISNLIIYPEMLTFATDWPFLLESKKNEVAKIRLDKFEVEAFNFKNFESDMQRKINKKNEELLQCIKIKTKIRFFDINSYIKSKEYFNQKIYDFYEKAEELRRKISTIEAILKYKSRFENEKNIDQQILRYLINNFDGSKEKLLYISEFINFIGIENNRIKELLYFMEHNDCKYVEGMVAYKNILDPQMFDLLDKNIHKFYDEWLFKDLKSWIANNSTKRVNNLNTDALYSRFQNQVYKPLNTFLKTFNKNIAATFISQIKDKMSITEITYALNGYVEKNKITPIFN